MSSASSATSSLTAFVALAGKLDPRAPDYAVRFVDALLDAAATGGASDLHLTPGREGLEIRARLDGVLQSLGRFTRDARTDVVARLKVLAHLPTYQGDAPQEGRLPPRAGLEVRLSTAPSLYGEKAVLRLFPVERRLSRLDELGLPEATVRTLQELVQETSGALLFVGPAGCGKTTTALACLREVVAGGALRSVVSLEDPIEVALDGVAQTQVDPATGLDLVHGLKFLLRQDPEVLLLGEIRDQATAEAVLQAALSGHLLLSTFHAPDALGALTRLLDMELPPYSVRSGVRGVVAQRLLRRLCSCAAWSDRPDDRLDLPVPRTRVAGRCDACRGSGYSGRVPVAELLRPDAPELVDRLRQRGSLVEALPSLRERGFLPLLDAALALVDSGVTSAAEVRRVFGFLRPGL